MGKRTPEQAARDALWRALPAAERRRAVSDARRAQRAAEAATLDTLTGPSLRAIREGLGISAAAAWAYCSACRYKRPMRNRTSARSAGGGVACRYSSHALAAWAGGLLDEGVMRALDILLAFPPILLALGIAAWVVLAPGLRPWLRTRWPWLGGLVSLAMLIGSSSQV